MNQNKLELDVLAYWNADDIFRRSMSNRRGCRPFVIYEGPPTANGRPGLHHVLTRTFKDIIARYWTMRGFYVERKAGWDEHGLPVEIEVQKSLGLQTKPEIESYGIDKFNKACAESTKKYISDWEKLTERMGYWVDMANAYRTSDPKYIRKVWDLLHDLNEKGLIEQSNKVVPWACDSMTALSNAEVALGYKEVTDISAYVKFQLECENTCMLAWTTTPWTLPGNMALAVNPDLVYKRYYVNGEHLISLLDFDAELTGTFTGKELAEMRYHPLFDDDQETYPILTADFVKNEKTGIVHIAPAFGADDYALYQKKMTSDLKIHVNHDGTFNDSAPEFLRGRKVFSQTFEGSNTLVLKHLGDQVFKTEPYIHSYPHNWRTGKPLIYILRPCWTFTTTKIKDQLVSANEQVEWFPDHLKDGRFGDWLRNNVDWCISRERFWGTPLPFSTKGQNITPNSEHRPTADSEDRTREVLDCWFDSGAMPFAAFDEYQQADVICEAIDQTRGWFYSLLAIGVAIRGESPYKRVLCLGHLLDKDGQKMAKSKGNTVDPWMLFEKYGADAIRWYMAKTTIGSSLSFTEAHVRNNVINRLLNCLSFYKTYSEIDKVHPNEVFELNVFDRWIKSAWSLMLQDTRTAYEEYNFSRVCELVDTFVDKLSNVWLRANRHRFWNTGGQGVDEAAYFILSQAICVTCKVLAPIMPFVSDYIFRQFNDSSVHLEDFPLSEVVEHDLLTKMETAQQIIVEGRRQRDENKIKVRQPLRKIVVPDVDMGGFEEYVKTELNVKILEKGTEITLDCSLDENLISEGVIRDFIRMVQVLRKESGFNVTDRIVITLDCANDLEMKLAAGLKEMTEKLLVVEWRKASISNKTRFGDWEIGITLEQV